MELIGVTHSDKYLNDVYSYVYTKYPKGPKSMLLELAENTEEILSSCFADPFFCSLSETFRIKGTEVIYGDLKSNNY